MPERGQSQAGAGRLFQRLHQASFALGRLSVPAEAADEATSAADAVGQVIVQFASGGDVDVVRLLVFTDHVDGAPTHLEMRESWTADDRQAFPYGMRLPLEKYPMADLLRPDEPSICENVEADVRIYESLRRLLTIAGLGSLAAVPMTAGDEWLGSILIGRRVPSTFDDDLLHAYWILASQAAATLTKRRLLAEGVEYRTLLNSIQSPVLALDEEMTVLYCNEAYAEFVGASVGGMEGKNLLEIVPGFRKLGSYAAYQQVIETGEPQVVEGPLGNRYIVTRIFRTPWGILSIADDITASKRAETDQERLLAEADVLYQASRLISTAQDTEQVLDAVLEYVSQLDLDRCLLALLDDADTAPRDRRIRIHAAWDRQGQESDLLGGRFSPADIPLLGKLGPDDRMVISDLASRRTAAGELTTVSLDPRTRTAFQELGVGAMAMIPLAVGGRLLGWLLAQTVGRPHSFAEREVEALQSIAGQAAVALQNLGLWGEARQRAAQLETAAEISGAASSILNLDELLPLAAELIRDRFGLYYVGIFLLDKEERYAALHAGTGDAGRRMVSEGHRLEVGGSSMIGSAIARGKARIALDVGEEAGEHVRVRFDNPLLPLTRSEMALPFISRGHVIGAMTIQSAKPAAFSQEDVTVLQTMADQLANTIENARLFQERERRITELSIVNEIGQALSSALELDELLETVHHQVSRLFDTSNFYIATYEEGSDEWISAFHLEGGERQSLARYGIEAGLTGHIIRGRQPLLFRTLEDNIRFTRREGGEIIGKMARSWLGVPLVAADKIVGVMAIQNYEQDGLYDEEDLALFSTVAGQVANALDNLRLLRETQGWARQLEVSLDVGQTIASVLDLDEVLRQIVDLVKERFGHYFVSIALVQDADGNGQPARLVFRYGSTIGDSNDRLEDLSVDIDLSQGSGLIIEAARSGGPILVGDVLNDPRYLPVAELPDTRSELAVPIVAKGRVIGTLDVQSDQPFAYDRTDVAITQSLAAQAAVAIDNAQLFEAERVARERAETLQAATQSLAAPPGTELDLQQVFASILTALGKVVPYDSATVQQLRGETRLEIIGGLGFANWDEILGLSFDLTAADNPNGEVVRGRAPLILEDAPTVYEGFRREPHAEAGIRSWLGVPLLFGNRLLGMIALDKREPGFYTEEHARLAAAFAAQAANAIENVRLFEEAQTRLARTQLLLSVGEATASVLDITEVMRRTARAAAQALGADATAAYLLDDAGRELRPVAGYHVPRELLKEYQTTRIAAVGHPLVEEVLRSGQTVVTSDALNDPRYDEELRALMPVRSMLLAPIAAKEQVIGVLWAVWWKEAYQLGEEEADLVQGIVRQVAVAVENARLFNERERRITELSILNEVMAAVSQQLELEDLLETIYGQVGRIMPADAFFLALYDEGTEQVTFPLLYDEGRRYAESPMPVPPRGNLRRVVESGEPLVINRTPEEVEALAADMPEVDAQTAQGAEGDLAAWGTNALGNVSRPSASLLYVPLRIGRTTTGVMSVQSYSFDAYDEQSMALLSSISGQVALAIEGARLFDETRRRAEELGTLHEVSLELAREQQDLDTVLETITRRTMDLLDSDGGGVWLWREEAKELELVITFQVGEIDFAGRRLKPGEGLTGRAFAERKIQVVDDYRTWEKRSEAFEDAPFISSMAVPMIWQREVVGALVATRSQEERPYTIGDQSLAELLAAQAAAVIQNARLFDETQRRLRELGLLFDASAALAVSLDVDRVVYTTAQQIVQALAADGCAISLWDREQDAVVTLLDYSEHLEWGTEEPGKIYRLEDCPLTRKVLTDRRPAIVQADDLEVAAQPEHAAELMWMADEEVQSLLMVPMVVRDEAIGLLELMHGVEGQRREFTPTEVSLCQTLANQAAYALENARLLEEARRRTSELETLYDTSLRLGTELEVDEVLRLIVERAVVLLGAEAAGFYLYEEASNELVFSVAEGYFSDFAGQRLRPGEGLAGRVFQERRSMTVEDYQAWSGRAAVYQKDGRLGMILGVPVVGREGVLGVLDIGTGREPPGDRDRQDGAGEYVGARFDEHDVWLAELLAAQAAVALDKARLFDETQRRLEELVMVSRLSRMLAEAPLRAEQIAEIIVRQLVEVMGVPEASVSLLDRDEGVLRMLADLYGEDGIIHLEEAEKLFALEDYPATARVMETSQPLVVHASDTDADPSELAYMKDHGTTTLVIIPLVAKGETVGVVELESWGAEHHYTERELELATTLANQAAVALDNARLFEDAQLRAEELAVINQVGQAATSVLDLDLVLREMVDAIKERLGYYFVGILLMEGDQLVFRSGSTAGETDVEWERGELRLDLGDYGLTVTAAVSGESILVNDVSTDLRYGTVEGLESVQAELDTPIKVKGQTIGVLTVQSDRRNAFQETDVALLQALAVQAGVAIENARLFAETEERARAMAALVEVGRVMASVLDEEQVIRYMVDTAKERFGYYFVGISLMEGSRLWFPYGSKIGNSEVRLEPSEVVPDIEADQPSLMAEAVRRGEPVVVDDVLEDPRYMPVPELAATRSEVDVPIEVRGRIIGVLDVQSDRPGAFDETDVALLQSLASQAGAAIDNARLFAETEGALAETEMLYNASRLLASAGDLQDMVAAVCEGMYLPAIRGAVLWEADRDEGGRARGFVARANWHGGEGTPPPAVGTRLQVEEFPATWLMLAPAPLFVEDVGEDGRIDALTREVLEDLEAGALAMLPLWVGRRQVGTLMLMAEEAHHFTTAEIRPYRSLAGQMAIVVENRRLLEQAQQSAQQSQVLFETSRALSSYLEEEPLMRAILEGVYRTLGCEFANISVVDEAAGTISSRHIIWQGEFGHFPEWVQMAQYPLDHPDIVADVYRTGRIELIDGWDERFNREIWEKFGHERFVRAFLPIKQRDRVLGVVEVSYDRAMKEAIGEEEVRLLAAFMDQAALALQNARLFEEIQARARREQVLREITTRVRGTIDTEAIMRTAVRELGAALGRPTFVRLGSAEELAGIPKTGGDGGGVDADEGGE